MVTPGSGLPQGAVQARGGKDGSTFSLPTSPITNPTVNKRLQYTLTLNTDLPNSEVTDFIRRQLDIWSEVTTHYLTLDTTQKLGVEYGVGSQFRIEDTLHIIVNAAGYFALINVETGRNLLPELLTTFTSLAKSIPSNACLHRAVCAPGNDLTQRWTGDVSF